MESLARERITAFSRTADIVKLTDEEAEWLSGVPGDEALRDPSRLKATFPAAKVRAGEITDEACYDRVAGMERRDGEEGGGWRAGGGRERGGGGGGGQEGEGIGVRGRGDGDRGGEGEGGRGRREGGRDGGGGSRDSRDSKMRDEQIVLFAE